MYEPEPSPPDSVFIGHALTMLSTLEMDEVLGHYLRGARELTGASWGGVSVLGIGGRTSLAVIQDPASAGPGALPSAELGRLTTSAGCLHLDQEHSKTELLGLSLRINGQLWGHLYVCDKPGGFTPTDHQSLDQLTRAARPAIENARAYAHARNRERWMAVSQQITTMLLEGGEEEDVLELIASRVREVADADTSLIVLPSMGQAYACEIADGYLAEEMVGLVFPPGGRAMRVLQSGEGIIVDSMARARALRVPKLAAFGAALYAPLLAHGRGTGVIVLFRKPGRPEFGLEDLAPAEAMAAQAALALELATARHSEDLTALLNERSRIARDLHDLAIQQLFATGMQLESARARASQGGLAPRHLDELLQQALASVDDSVQQIRSIVHDLREADDQAGLTERIRRETSLARLGLGFAPSLIVSLDGHAVSSEDDTDDLLARLDERVTVNIADDAVAVVREGLSNAARHARATAVTIECCAASADYLSSAPLHRPVDPALEPLAQWSGILEIRVSDNGSGIGPQNLRRSGLSNLTARARGHRGSFHIEPAPEGRGTVLRWQIPLP